MFMFFRPDAASPSGVENGGVISTSADSVAGKPPLPPGATTGNGTLLSNGGGAQTKTASIRARPTSSRITAAEMQEIFADSTTGNKCGTWNGPPHKIYASVAEMKRSKVRSGNPLILSRVKIERLWCRNLARFVNKFRPIFRRKTMQSDLYRKLCEFLLERLI